MDLSPASLLASLLVSSIGLAFLVYGRKQARLPQILAGIAMLLESALVPDPGWMLASAVLALGALWVGLRSGL